MQRCSYCDAASCIKEGAVFAADLLVGATGTSEQIIMAPLPEVTTLPAETGDSINEKKIGSLGGTGPSEGSEAAASVLSDQGKLQPKVRLCNALTLCES